VVESVRDDFVSSLRAMMVSRLSELDTALSEVGEWLSLAEGWEELVVEGGRSVLVHSGRE
jgi:hypothetical protein